MAQIAIKGHDTRGKEVIEILEMLGGKNDISYFGDDDDAVYSIEGQNIVIYELEAIKNDDFIVFTLEEFLEKYPYKVGDKVKTLVNGSCGFFDIQDMTWYCVSKVIKYKVHGYWLSAENLQPYKEETMEERKYADLRLDVDQDDKLATEATIDGDKITAPENYLIGKVTKVDNGVLVEFVKKQPQYPKTYEECCKVMGIDSDNFLSIRNFHCDDGDEVTTKYEQDFLGVLDSLREVKICRDVYWKIAGEQMGLGKPWEPNWEDESEDKYTIVLHGNKNCYANCKGTCSFLTFPTAEMRDAFHDNFKDLIEDCQMFL